MATIAAASASTADVQGAVNSASDGDTVTIPNGSATWTSGITTTKQIVIRALNYTSTPAGTEGAGATTRNVTITNNSASPLLSMTSGNTYHVGVGGIAFLEGTGGGAHVAFAGSGSKPPLLFDCYMENKLRLSPDDHCIEANAKGGVVWNCVVHGTFSDSFVGEGLFVLKPPSPTWTTASTMGDLDTGGTANFYIEDCTFVKAGLMDIDDHGRLVMRHCIMDGTWAETHGFSSLWGGRWWEFYDMVWKNTDSKNMAGRYFWCRAGSGIFTDCEVNPPPNTSNYGNISLLNIGDTSTPGTYLMARQPGCGHNGSTYVSDPIYIWNNTGSRAYTWGFQGTPGGWDAIVVQDRDVFVNNGAKPDYTKYTYPHPLRSGIGGGGSNGGSGTIILFIA